MMFNRLQLIVSNCCNCRYSPYFVYSYKNRTSHFTVPQLQNLATDRMVDVQMINYLLSLNMNICSHGKNSLYIFRILRHHHTLPMLEINFNIIFPSTVDGFKFFDFHLVFILKFCTRFLFLHTTRSTNFSFVKLVRLRKFIRTAYNNITSAN